MRWAIYNLLFSIVYVLMLPRFFWRMWRRGGYANRFRDRFGNYPAEIREQLASPRRRVWVHAVSVGEVYVAGRMMSALRARDPDISFVFSTTSSTGWREARKQVGDGDTLIYNPLDFNPCVKKTLDTVRPRALILTESEIWPNLIRHCHQRGIPVFLINARVSDRSAPGYRWLRFWFGPILRMFSLIMAQSESDKQRLVDAGAQPETIEVTGSFKFDVAARNPEQECAVASFLEQCGCGGDTIILLGGSTWPGEDTVLLDIYKELRQHHPRLRLALVPRHFEKADAVQAEIERAGFVCIRKSRRDRGEARGIYAPGDAVALGDTTGELMGFYGNAHIAFVGKSLRARGAQNMIEPCLCGIATLVGPYTENFRPVMADLLEARAIMQVGSASELKQAIDTLLSNPRDRAALGRRAAALVQRRKGVVAHCAKLLSKRV